MNIRSISFSNAISFLQQNVHHPLSKQQKKIFIIAVAALSILTACYILKCCCFKAKSLNGTGKMTKDGKVFAGVFKDGKLEGAGSITYPDGTKYVGEFRQNQFEGAGKRIAKDGAVVAEGIFISGQLNGTAKLVFEDKAEYDGECKDNKMHGHGKLKEPDGTIYEGEFQTGSRHGKGTITEKDGTIKDVEYVEGKIKEEEAESDETEDVKKAPEDNEAEK